MANGIAYAHELDPATKLETWIFQEIGRTPGGKPIYRRLPYNLVQYDNQPVQYIEPAAASPFVKLSGEIGDPIVPTAGDGCNRIVEFMFVTGHPFEAFAYNDYNIAASSL